MHCAGQTYDDIINTIDILARMAAAGTLKKIYTTSAHEQIRKYQFQLQADFKLTDNMGTENLTKHFSDAYDIYLTAYDYLYDKIMIETLTPNCILSETLKNGTTKTRTVYQWACIKVRQYIYSHKAIENNSKYIYIEDLKKSSDDTTENALDREYIRVGKYNDIHDYNDFTTVSDILNALDLSRKEKDILNLRLRGLSTTEIADKYDVTHQAISKNLLKIQEKVKDIFPDMVRGFKDKRII